MVLLRTIHWKVLRGTHGSSLEFLDPVCLALFPVVKSNPWQTTPKLSTACIGKGMCKSWIYNYSSLSRSASRVPRPLSFFPSFERERPKPLSILLRIRGGVDSCRGDLARKQQVFGLKEPHCSSPWRDCPWVSSRQHSAHHTGTTVSLLDGLQITPLITAAGSPM